MGALLYSKPFYSVLSNLKPTSSGDVSRPVPNQEPATEEVSLVASPTVETNPKFFFGTGDGSNGYYGERAEPARQ